jgi:transposase InsO family protein
MSWSAFASSISTEGSKFASKAVMGLLKQYGLPQSFTRVGMPSDNTCSDSFFSTMKKELIHWTHYETKEPVMAAVLSIYIVFAM